MSPSRFVRSTVSTSRSGLPTLYSCMNAKAAIEPRLSSISTSLRTLQFEHVYQDFFITWAQRFAVSSVNSAPSALFKYSRSAFLVVSGTVPSLGLLTLLLWILSFLATRHPCAVRDLTGTSRVRDFAGCTAPAFVEPCVFGRG